MPLLLKTSEQWDQWYCFVKEVATGTQIWEYANLEASEERFNEEPKEPSGADINPDARTWLDLENQDKNYFLLRGENHKNKIIEFKERKRALQQLSIMIFTSVDLSLWIVTRDAHTPYQKST